MIVVVDQLKITLSLKFWFQSVSPNAGISSIHRGQPCSKIGRIQTFGCIPLQIGLHILSSKHCCGAPASASRSPPSLLFRRTNFWTATQADSNRGLLGSLGALQSLSVIIGDAFWRTVVLQCIRHSIIAHLRALALRSAYAWTAIFSCGLALVCPLSHRKVLQAP